MLVEEGVRCVENLYLQNLVALRDRVDDVLTFGDFAKHGVQGPGVASFRLGALGWEELEPDAAAGLICFEGADGVR